MVRAYAHVCTQVCVCVSQCVGKKKAPYALRRQEYKHTDNLLCGQRSDAHTLAHSEHGTGG